MNITMEDIPINLDWTRLDILAVVCEHVLDKEKEAETAMHQAERQEPFNQQILLMKEKKLKDQGKARIISRRREEEKYRIVGKKRNFKRTKSETGEILPMPQIVKNRINQLEKDVKEVKLIIEKEIYKTDASEPHNRLSIPTTQILEKFLTDEEEEYLCMYSNDNRRNLKKVRVIDPSLDIDELELRRWEMNMSASYVLNGKWTKMRIRNKIKKGDRIQIWAVRMDDDELIIVIVKLSPDEEEEDDDEVTIQEANIEEQKDSNCINNLAH
ncbi:B3 domain-containing protein At5g24050-like [Solanum stenotomum]|uniref:B3 domain-containing protein At5g24050-like n=1 Tax=Solanum stenotomum TaxID=172797 RepID=UPI0020D1AD70|nr:B3 domain-containing protein At5g24050-like [Solanum stenotomum]